MPLEFLYVDCMNIGLAVIHVGAREVPLSILGSLSLSAAASSICIDRCTTCTDIILLELSYDGMHSNRAIIHTAHSTVVLCDV